MTARSTAVSAVLVAALAGAVWVMMSGRPSARQLETRRGALFPIDPAEAERIEITTGEGRTVLEKRAEGRWGRRRGALFPFEPAEGERIEITRGEGRTVLEKRAEGWVLTEPVEDVADAAAVGALLEKAAGLRSAETLGADPERGGVNARELGLASGRVSLAVSGPGWRRELWFGKETAVEGRQYVRVAGEGLIDVAPSDLGEMISGGADVFRAREIFGIAEPEAVAVRWQRGKGVFELARDGARWVIRKPERARADAGRVRALLRNLGRARVEEFLPEAEGPAPAVVRDGGWVEIEDAAGRKATVEGIAIRDGRLTGRLAERNAAVALPGLLSELFELTPRDLRERSLLWFEPDAVDRVRIERAGEELTLTRDGSRWKGAPGGFEADPERAEVLLRMLRTAGLAEFAGDTRADAPEAGLEAPSATLRLLAVLSEDGVNESAGERVIGVVRLGASRADGRVYAANDAEPFVFTIPGELAAYVTAERREWLSRAVLFGEPEDVTWIEGDGGAWRVARDEEGRWKVSRGRGAPDAREAESLARALARLRAAEWLEEAPAEAAGPAPFALRFGWDHPDLAAERALRLEIWPGAERVIARLSSERRWFALPTPLAELLLGSSLSR